VQRSKRANNLNPNKNLFIRNFPESWSEQDIHSFLNENFKTFGETISVGICKDRTHNKHYAFVAYNSEDDARNAHDQMNNEEIPGHDERLYVNFAKSKRQFKMEQMQKFIQQPTNLYIKWLRADITEEEIKQAFESYGLVTSVCLRENIIKAIPQTPTTPGQQNTMMPANNLNLDLGFAFVNFASSADASNALTHGKNNEMIKSLLDCEWEKNPKQDFLFYAQNKINRLSYLKAKRKKKNTMISMSNMSMLFKTLKSNPQMQKQISKILQQQGMSGFVPGAGNGKSPLEKFQ